MLYTYLQPNKRKHGQLCTIGNDVCDQSKFFTTEKAQNQRLKVSMTTTPLIRRPEITISFCFTP